MSQEFALSADSTTSLREFFVMMHSTLMMTLWALLLMIDMVDAAVNTDQVEVMFAGLALASAIVAVYAAQCSHDAECDEKFFTDMKTESWSKQKVNEYLDDMGISGGIKTVARSRLMVWIAGEGGSTSTSKPVEVKMEPELAAESARSEARASGMNDQDILSAGKSAMDKQLIVNEKLECTSVYARALRAEGGEGVKIDRALMGEDDENEMVEEENGAVVIKRPTSASVADKWRTLEDAQEGISDMQQRAHEDQKFHIVHRLRCISDYLMLLSLPKRLPYVKRLFKAYYQGIPEAQSDKVLRKVNNDWEMGLTASPVSKKTSTDESKELKNMREEMERLKKKLAGKSDTASGSADQRKCHLCKQTGHLIADCPEQCKVCSAPGAQVHKDKCECEAN